MSLPIFLSYLISSKFIYWCLNKLICLFLIPRFSKEKETQIKVKIINGTNNFLWKSLFEKKLSILKIKSKIYDILAIGKALGDEYLNVIMQFMNIESNKILLRSNFKDLFFIYQNIIIKEVIK